MGLPVLSISIKWLLRETIPSAKWLHYGPFKEVQP